MDTSEKRCSKKRKAPHKDSQAGRVLAYLESGNTLTSLEAVHTLGILRLPNRIGELRNRYGVEIFQRTVRVPRGHKSVAITEYSLFPFEAVPKLEED